jgi:3-oxoacyl-[acyl-carrier protein] reductase
VDALSGKVALITGGSSTDIASPAAYLASDEGRFITGAALTIDGGANA